MNQPTKFRIRFGMRRLLLLISLVACVLAYWRYYTNRVAKRERAIHLLASAPDDLGWEFNPSDLVRAVNHLHSLGRDEALVALEDFNTKNPNEGYSSPHQCLQLVIPLLFDRRNPEDKLPRSANFYESSEDFVLTADKWDNRLHVEDSIPFHTEYVFATSGNPGNQGYLIAWARDHARLRTTPLAPGDIFHAAEIVMQRLQKQNNQASESHQWTNRHIREQVYRAVQHLLDREVVDKGSLAPHDDERWEKLKRVCNGLDIYWDDESQMFQSKQAPEVRTSGTSQNGVMQSLTIARSALIARPWPRISGWPVPLIRQ